MPPAVAALVKPSKVKPSKAKPSKADALSLYQGCVSKASSMTDQQIHCVLSRMADKLKLVTLTATTYHESPSLLANWACNLRRAGRIRGVPEVLPEPALLLRA